MTWQSSLPRVATMADSPCLVHRQEAGAGGRPRGWRRSAICTLPSVPFLKPTGTDRPDASSRWTWLSVVRAPIAPQVTRSAMYCGVIVSRNSQPAGTPSSARSQQQLAREAQALVDAEAAVEVRVVDQALPADGRARLLEVDAHDDAQRVRTAGRQRLQPLRVLAGRVHVVDRAGADHDDQAVVLAAQAARDRARGSRRRCRGAFADRQLLHQDRRRDQRPDALDAKVVGQVKHVKAEIYP